MFFKNKGFFYALILHGAIFLFCVISVFWQKIFFRKNIKIFELVPPQRQESVPVKKQQEPIKNKPEVVSYDEFIKKQGKPKERPIVTDKKNITTPKISTENIRQSLIKVSKEETSEVDYIYISEIKQMIDNLWEQPSGIANKHLLTEIKFQIKSNGIINDPQIIKSSGNSLFDASIMQAFSKIRKLPNPPYNRDYEFKLAFEIK